MNRMKLFNDGWSFLKTELDVEVQEVLKRHKEFQKVDIPHDWLIYQVDQLYENSCGWYQKAFHYTKKDAFRERVFLRFDGVYMDCQVFVNGQIKKEWKYGYSTFDADISSALVEGKNEILVKVNHRSPNSRWYSGAGIYRNVWIKECSDMYLPFDGTYVVSRPEGEDYRLDVETEVAGENLSQGYCQYTLWYQGKKAADLGQQKIDSALERVYFTGIVPQPKTWDLDHPECYQLQVELFDGEQLESVDEQFITIGFRTMEFDPNLGFLLNGKQVKVHGVCEHHDLGCLGAAFSREAMKRKFQKLGEMGVNGIRTSHNMPDPQLMDLADEMGFLVVNEAFDMWEMSKTEYDYARFFKEWAEADVRSWIRRDRNHPSLMLWSIGNEIYDTHASERGQEITKELVHMVREHDPKKNGEVTIGSNYMPWENARKCADIVKIAGYNYAERYYDSHHATYKDWVIYGSETASIVHSRGVYHFPLAQSVLADEDEQCSSLGNSTTSWGAKSIEKCITDDRDAEYCFGQFLWTGFDYIGEPTPYHTKNSYFGQLDTAGFPKDAYYIFQAEWTDGKEKPMVHLFPYWDFNEGQLIDVRACTNGDAVELFVNGTSLGKQEIDHKRGLKLLGEWQVPYKKGEIKAVAYHKSGEVIAEEKRVSFGDGVKICIESNKEYMKADGMDLCFITISVEDSNGNPVENAMNIVTVEVSGSGRLLGLDNGDSTDYDAYKGNCRKLFNGKLLAVIGAKAQPGDIKINVTGCGLIEGELILHAQEAFVPEGISYKEDCSKEVNAEEHILQPVRKLELKADRQELTRENPSALVRVRIYPEDASDLEIVWKVVNDRGIEIPYACVEEIEAAGNIHIAKVTSKGDGGFRVRCMSKSGSDKIKLISQLEMIGMGLGRMHLNPYEFISAGLYTDVIGNIGNGNEKGIATASDGKSGVVFSNIDFGDYGSDEITMPMFSLSTQEYPVEIWQGKPEEEGSRLIATKVYQKPFIWNVYQEITWKLPERLKGIMTISFVLRDKIHIKGFSFKRYEKAFAKLTVSECTEIYGDSFQVEDETVTQIGNNVTMSYDQMNFDAMGASRIKICGKSELEKNTIHLLFVKEEGEVLRQIVEFKGSKEWKEQEFDLEKLTGTGTIEFVFLPGSQFDFKYFQFEG